MLDQPAALDASRLRGSRRVGARRRGAAAGAGAGRAAAESLAPAEGDLPWTSSSKNMRANSMGQVCVD